MRIKNLQADVFEWAKSKGWADRKVDIPEQVALIHSEASEALESWRKNEPIRWTDEKGKPEGIASEYADIVIRVCHYAELLGIDLEKEIHDKMQYNKSRPFRHGNKQG